MFGCEGVRAHDVVKSRRKPSGSIPRMTKQVVGICPECGAKNILPEPEPAHFRQVGNIPLLIGFDCFKCKKRVDIPISDTTPLEGV